MKRIVITSGGEPEKKQGWTKRQKVFLGWTLINLMLSFCLAIYSIAAKWGSSALAIVWLVLLAAYVIIFVVVLILGINKGVKAVQSRLKYTIAGVKMLTKLSNLANLIMTLFMLLTARVKGDISVMAAIASIVVLFLFTLIGIILSINDLIKKKS